MTRIIGTEQNQQRRASSEPIRPEAETAHALVESASADRRRRVLLDVAGVLWVNAMAVIYVLPEITRGIYPGFTWDQFTELVPWSNLTWSQVHHGHLPLWNPYSALGLPLGFNGQAAPLSVTTIVGYVLPEHWGYTAEVLLTSLIAGTGAYVCGRVLRLGVLGSAMAGTTFVLCGSFVWVLNWPVATAASWLGWLFAGIVLVVRGGRHRTWFVALLAVVVAQTVYAGQLDTLGLVSIATAIFVVALFVVRALKEGVRAQLRPAGAVAVSILAGAALSAPILLPGLQLAAGSAHTQSVQSGTMTPEFALNMVFSVVPFAPAASFVGLIGIVMALVGVVTCWRRMEVRALGIMAIALGLLAFVPVSYSWLEHLPLGRSVQWFRLLIPLSFGLAVLAGVGVDHLARRPYQRRFPEVLTAVFVGTTLLFAIGWEFTWAPHGPILRTQTFLWFAVSVGIGLLVGAALFYGRVHSERTNQRQPSATLPRMLAALSRGLGRGWWAAAILIACETTFLLVAGNPNMVTISTSRNVVTPTDRALAAKAHTTLVGFSGNLCVGEVPIVPELNDELGVRELSAYDPMLPNSYFTVWQQASGNSAKSKDLYQPGTTFCPAITSARLARLFGVGLVVTPHGAPGPSGTVFDGTVGNVDLYRVPGAAVATVSNLRPDGSVPGVSAPGRPAPATQPYPGAWRIETSSTTRQVLRIRVTNVPGWHATIDGHPLALESFDKVMLQTRLPAGKHTVVLTYWPKAFTAGLLLAAVAVVGLAGALVVHMRRAKRNLEGPSHPDQGMTSGSERVLADDVATRKGPATAMRFTAT